MSTRPDDVASCYWLVSSGPSDIQMTKMPRTFRNGVYLLKWGRGLVWGFQGAKRGCDLFLSAFVSCRKIVWKFDSLLMWRALWPLISFLSWLSRGALVWSRPLKVLFAVNKTLLENLTCRPPWTLNGETGYSVLFSLVSFPLGHYIKGSKIRDIWSKYHRNVEMWSSLIIDISVFINISNYDNEITFATYNFIKINYFLFSK